MAGKLSASFTNFTLKLFADQKEESGESSWTVESVKAGHQQELLQEWTLFSVAAYINGCRSSMKQDAVHFEFVRSFVAACARNFVELGTFSSEPEFTRLAMGRLSEYLDAFSGSDVEEALQNVARKFLQNVGCSPNDIAHRVVAAGHFVNESVETKKMFDSLQASYRIVLNPT